MTEASPKARRWTRLKPVAFVVGVFLLGGVCGAGLTRALMFREVHQVMDGPPSEARAHFRMQAMRRHLDLDDVQAVKIEQILGESEAERDKIAQPCKPGFDELRTRTDSRIREVLRPDQREAYEKFSKKMGRFAMPPSSSMPSSAPSASSAP